MQPDSFWKQTPRTFMAIMEGRSRAAQTAFEERIAEAWHVAAFSGQAKLKPLKEYLAALKPPKPQSPADMVETLKAIAGDKITIQMVEIAEPQ